MRLPEKSRDLGDRGFEHERLHVVREQTQPDHAARRRHVVDFLAERRHIDHAAQMVAVLVEAGERRHLEALIGADEQLHRPDGGFDGAEPQALGLTLRAAELACGIDPDLDAAVGGLFQLGLVDLDILMLHVVEGLGRELHGEFLRPRRLRGENDTGNGCQGGGGKKRLPCPRVPDR